MMLGQIQLWILAILRSIFGLTPGTGGTAGSSPTFSGSFPVAGTYRMVSVQPGTTANGPFTVEFHEALFQSTYDPAMCWGYNQTSGGVPIKASENALSWFIEGNYDDNSGTHKMEAYLQYISADGLTSRRPLMIQMDRSTNKCTQFDIKNDVTTFTNDAGATMFTVQTNQITAYAADSSATNFFKIAGASGHSGVLNLGFDGTDGYMQFFPTAADNGSVLLNSRTIIYLFSATSAGAGSSIAVGVQDNGAAGTFKAPQDSTIGVVARANSATQTGSLIEAQGVSGQAWCVKVLTELTTIAAAATTTTAIQLPAGAVILAVTVRTTVVIPTATSFSVGDSGSATRYNTANVGVAANSTDAGTKAGVFYNASATGVLLTMNGGTPAANTGRVRVTILYYSVTPATS